MAFVAHFISEMGGGEGGGGQEIDWIMESPYNRWFEH